MPNMQQKTHRKKPAENGFTLVELLIGGTAMLIVILGTMFIYMRSNQISVDQQMFSELQHDVRSSMYFVTRDIRHSGVGLPWEFAGYYLEGLDNEDQGAAVDTDRLIIMGNMEDPLNVTISNYQGSAANAALIDYSFEQYHYPDEYYDDRFVLIIPNPDSGCVSAEVRVVTHVTHSQTGTNERFNFSPGLAPDVNPPGNLSGTCPDSHDYDGGMITFIEVKEFWLDQTGNYPGLTAGENGYIGNGESGILYMTQNAYHYALAQNVENLQFEYNGDFDDDVNNQLDGWQPWDPNWTGDPVMVGRVQQIRIWILGRTPNAYAHVPKAATADVHLYRRPLMANTTAESQDDMHRRFLLQSTVNVRNLTMDIYNTGERR